MLIDCLPRLRQKLTQFNLGRRLYESKVYEIYLKTWCGSTVFRCCPQYAYFPQVYAGEGGGNHYTGGCEDFSAGALPPPGTYFLDYFTTYTSDRLNDDHGRKALPDFYVNLAALDHNAWPTSSEVFYGVQGTKTGLNIFGWYFEESQFLGPLRDCFYFA